MYRVCNELAQARTEIALKLSKLQSQKNKSINLKPRRPILKGAQKDSHLSTKASIEARIGSKEYKNTCNIYKQIMPVIHAKYIEIKNLIFEISTNGANTDVITAQIATAISDMNNNMLVRAKHSCTLKNLSKILQTRDPISFAHLNTKKPQAHTAEITYLKQSNEQGDSQDIYEMSLPRTK